MKQGEWPAAFKPLRPRTLTWQLLALATAEFLLYTSYATHEARFHWATHFLVGLTAAALWRALFLLVAARPTRYQLLSILGFHLWAMWPDLVFRTPGIPHYHWMDWVALGHVSSHYMPGGDATWLVVALTVAGGYAVLLWQWLKARHAEAGAGLPPALGVGGSGTIRAQHSPLTHVLAHETQGAVADAAEPLVLLHGLGATSSTWRPAAERLRQAGAASIVPDLLGFGSSKRIGTRFGLEEQADAVLRLLDHHHIERAHLVAHSWGSAVAAAVAERSPERVSRMTLVAPAVFNDVEAAKRRFSKRSILAKKTLNGSPLGELVCGAMCLTRPLLGRVAPRMEPDVPPQVARDGVQHSYAAYADALASMWEGNPLEGLLKNPPCPVTVVLADDDETVLPSDVLDLPPGPGVHVVQVAGDHSAPYTRPELVADLVLADRSEERTEAEKEGRSRTGAEVRRQAGAGTVSEDGTEPAGPETRETRWRT